MMTRCVKDKVPKGSYVIRAGILDRLVENKLYYKFLDHGKKVRAEEQAKKDKEEEDEQRSLSRRSSNSALF